MELREYYVASEYIQKGKVATLDDEGYVVNGKADECRPSEYPFTLAEEDIYIGDHVRFTQFLAKKVLRS